MPSVAVFVREEKERYPDRFCYNRKCLWRVVHRDGKLTPCPKHPDQRHELQKEN
jgi:hypothetical protein